MQINANKLVHFVNKTFSIKQNATWKAENFAELFCKAAKYNTYVETVKSEDVPDADTFSYRIKEDASVFVMLETFMKITKTHAKKLKGKKCAVIIDYTHEPFFGKTKNEWIHGYKPKDGSLGSFEFLSVSVVLGEKRYFVYAKPMSNISDEGFEIMQALAHLDLLEIKIKCVLMDRGFAKSSDILAIFETYGIKYLGLYPKYRNVKKIIENMK
jgi:hypothetical protein